MFVDAMKISSSILLLAASFPTDASTVHARQLANGEEGGFGNSLASVFLSMGTREEGDFAVWDPSMSYLRGQLGKPGKSGKSGKCESGKSGKSGKSVKSGKSGKSGESKSSKCSIPLLYDINGDDEEDLNDVILVLRAIDDPIGGIEPGLEAADVNEDGVVDLDDVVEVITYLSNTTGPESIAPLTPNYFDDDDDFPWDQPPLEVSNNRRRLHILKKDEALSGEGSSPEWVPPGLRRLDTCGAQTGLSLSKGTGPKPTINWDFFNCAFDATVYPNMSIGEKAAAHASWVKYGTLLTGALFLLPDGAKAYARYRDNSGSELAVNYEKAISEDSVVRAAVDAEIADVKSAVKELFDGAEGSFQFHSTSARSVPNGSTENWQKAIGGHRIWSEGTVTYDSGSCQLNVAFKIYVEDYYNFNPGQSDIGSGLPDDDNCLFSIIGWARPFYSRNSVDRSETIDLVCCEDTDCGDVTEFDCECNKCVTQCPTNQASGGQGFTSFSVDLLKTSGTITVFYQMYTIPDQLKIYYEGATIFSTGGLVSGSKTTSVTYGSAASTSTVVTVEVDAPNSGTAWQVSVSCPP